MMILCAIPMICAAVTDMRKRIIPDWTWIVVFLIGCVSAFFFESVYLSLTERILGLMLTGLSMIIIVVKYSGIGGGDIKLMTTMGFCFGVFGLTVILLFTVASAYIYSYITKQKSVPLAVFLCIGFFIYLALSLNIGGGLVWKYYWFF